MRPFQTETGLAAPLRRVNVDTDSIIPKQFLKSIVRTGFGANLFHDWRSNADFVLNQEVYHEPRILVAGDNFGCGSSREHAVWAVMQYGFRAVVSSSFADIFHSNAVKNGLLLAQVSPSDLETIFDALEATPGVSLKVDLRERSVSLPDGRGFAFQISDTDRSYLLEGLDEISRSLKQLPEVERFEADYYRTRPWL